jgi:hypothetical protein
MNGAQYTVAAPEGVDVYVDVEGHLIKKHIPQGTILDRKSGRSYGGSILHAYVTIDGVVYFAQVNPGDTLSGKVKMLTRRSSRKASRRKASRRKASRRSSRRN